MSRHAAATSGRPQSAPEGRPAGGPKGPQQFVNYAFYKLDPTFLRLDLDVQREGVNELLEVLDNPPAGTILLCYSTVGFRGDCDMMLWRISERGEDIAAHETAIRRTGMGRYLEQAFNYLSLTKRSTYIDKLDPDHTESRTRVVPGRFEWLFVYPFVKTRAWYMLGQHVRQGVMDEHIEVGNRYPSVKLNTTYSFGLDDQEFMLGFETDKPGDFLDLVMELRHTEGSKYTLRDTPIFTCRRSDPRSMLSAMGVPVE